MLEALKAMGLANQSIKIKTKVMKWLDSNVLCLFIYEGPWTGHKPNLIRCH